MRSVGWFIKARNRKRMAPTSSIVAIATLIVALSHAFAQAPPDFSDSAVLTRSNGVITISTNGPRPMRDVLDTVSQEYGWTLDYEDPIFRARIDATDVADDAWRKLNPGRAALFALRGGKLTATYEASLEADPDEESRAEILAAVVKSYPQQDLPGSFSIKTEQPGYLAVVGSIGQQSGTVPAFLDTLVTIPRGTMSVSDGIQAVLGAASAATGVASVLASAPLGVLESATVTFDGTTVTARAQIRALLNRTPVNLGYSLLYDENNSNYHFNVYPVVRSVTDSYGHVRFIPAARPQP